MLASIGHDDGQGGDDLVEEMRRFEAKRARLVELYTDGDITRTEFRSRRAELDEQTNELDAEIARRRSSRQVVDVPASLEELTNAWDTHGIEFQGMLVEALLEAIIVNPAGRVRRKFDPERVEIRPRA